ncbi:UNVERIFIED_CONTAM: hypothetical protein FKN15_041562 [Acipenser sinensis]
MRDGVMCRRTLDPNTHEVQLQILAPEQNRKQIWETYHTHAGHLGVDKTLSVLRRRFFWPKMEKDVQHWHATCNRCNLRKARPEGKAKLMPIGTSAPFEVLAVDFLSLGRPNDTYQYILVATDMFTRFTWAIPTRDQTAITTARVLWQHIIQPFGCPSRLHSDQGPNFESELIKSLCQYYGARKSRTTPYHPQGNGLCERFNQTLLNLLGTLEVEQQNRWPQYLPELVHAYNNTVHETTGYTPFFLMFGRHARLPTDVLFGTPEVEREGTLNEWVAQHHAKLYSAYQKAGKRSGQAAERSKSRYDRTARDAPLLPGERVLVSSKRRRGRGKLADRWESEPYVVVERIDSQAPVYRVRPEGQDGPTRVIHRNLLRPCILYPQEMLDRPPEIVTQREDALQPMWGYLFPQGAGEGAPPPRRSERENRGRLPARYLQ